MSNEIWLHGSFVIFIGRMPFQAPTSDNADPYFVITLGYYLHQGEVTTDEILGSISNIWFVGLSSTVGIYNEPAMKASNPRLTCTQCVARKNCKFIHKTLLHRQRAIEPIASHIVDTNYCGVKNNKNINIKMSFTKYEQ